MPIRAILFDFDGVLADTENIHVAAWERTFDRMGWAVGPETCARAAEVDDRQFLLDVAAERKVKDVDVDGWLQHKQALTVQLLRDSAPVYPGAIELVRRLEGRVRLAVVTGTWRENVVTLLMALGIDRAFERVIAKEDVSAPKPDPQGYQLALVILGLEARDVVALEDSPSGLAAANGAGVPAVAVGHRRPPGDWHGDHPYLADLTDPAAIEKRLGLGA